MGIICPPPVGIGLTDLPNIGGTSGPPGPPSSGTTAIDFFIQIKIEHGIYQVQTRKYPAKRKKSLRFEPGIFQIHMSRYRLIRHVSPDLTLFINNYFVLSNLLMPQGVYYSSNKIRKTQNKHLIIVCQNLISP